MPDHAFFVCSLDRFAHEYTMAFTVSVGETRGCVDFGDVHYPVEIYTNHTLPTGEVSYQTATTLGGGHIRGW